MRKLFKRVTASVMAFTLVLGMAAVNVQATAAETDKLKAITIGPSTNTYATPIDPTLTAAGGTITSTEVKVSATAAAVAASMQLTGATSATFIDQGTSAPNTDTEIAKAWVMPASDYANDTAVQTALTSGIDAAVGATPFSDTYAELVAAGAALNDGDYILIQTSASTKSYFLLKVKLVSPTLESVTINGRSLTIATPATGMVATSPNKNFDVLMANSQNVSLTATAAANATAPLAEFTDDLDTATNGKWLHIAKDKFYDVYGKNFANPAAMTTSTDDVSDFSSGKAVEDGDVVIHISAGGDAYMFNIGVGALTGLTINNDPVVVAGDSIIDTAAVVKAAIKTIKISPATAAKPEYDQSSAPNNKPTATIDTNIAAAAQNWFVVPSKADFDKVTAMAQLLDLAAEVPLARSYENGGPLNTGNIIVLKDADGKYYAFEVTISGTGQGGMIEGSNDIEDLVINVIMPTNLDFSLDPMQITPEIDTDSSNGGTNAKSGRVPGSQISSVDYKILNVTMAPVKVTLDIEVNDGTSDASLNVVADRADVADGKDDDSIKTKKVFLAALGAKDALKDAPASIAKAELAKATVFDYEAVTTGTGGAEELTAAVVPFAAPTAQGSTAEAEAKIMFALGAATDVGTLDPANGTLDSTKDSLGDTFAATDKGISAFTLYGELHTYADWAAEDIELVGNYTLTALRGATYISYDGDSGASPAIPPAWAEDTLNMLAGSPVGPVYDLTLTAGEAAVSAGTYNTKADAEDQYFILLSEKPASITKVERTAPNGVVSSAFSSGTEYTYTASTGLLEANLSALVANQAGVHKFVVTAGSSIYRFNVTISST